MQNRLVSILAALGIIVLLLPACGKKGDLYLPDPITKLEKKAKKQ
ncbi:MAG: lipoprotein [Gammaproteobacteria bacterium]|nr:lipoprotein [Gammaproteobacteria bacterium]MDH5694930.1 lipoprotein [Gammaproteobacteria bacterium]